MSRRLRPWLAIATLTALTACSSGFSSVQDLPLPGGADLGDHPYRVTAQFTNVLDLVPQAAVKVNDVLVGRVEAIGLAEDGWTAEAVLAVHGDVELPADAVASVRQSSLLGEKFVELAAPPRSVAGASTLRHGAVIPVGRTNRHAEAEEVFGALSLLLNGGGISQLQTISRELSTAMDGNENEIRTFLASLDELVANLDAHRGDITAALDGLNHLSTTLAGREQQVSNALTGLTPGLQVLAEQRTALVTMLQALDELGDVAVDVVTRSRDDLVADLAALAPILRRLAEAGQALPQALEILPTFPFTDAVLDGIRGDYLNVFVEVTPEPGFTQPLPPLPLPTTELPTPPPPPPGQAADPNPQGGGG